MVDKTVAAIKTFITNINLVFYLLPLVFFLLFKRSTKEKALRVIFFYLLYALLNETVNFYFYQKRIDISDIAFPIDTITEYTFFSIFYYYALGSNAIKKIIFPLWVLFFVFASIDFFLINKMNSFDSVTSGIEGILIIIMCIYYLFIQIKGVNDLFVYSTSNFWIIITFLISISGTFFLYIMADKYMAIREYKIQYLIINFIFALVKNILFCIAMLMKPANTNKVQTDKNWDDFLTHNIIT